MNDNLKKLQKHIEKSNGLKQKMLEYKKNCQTTTFHVFDKFLIKVTCVIITLKSFMSANN